MKTHLLRWLCAMALVVCVEPASGFLFMSDVLTVTLTVVDDHGEPVPYATVGSVWSPYEEQDFDALKPEDMWRTLTRNPSDWEYWSKYSNSLMHLQFSGLTTTSGQLIEQLDYAESASNRRPRPANWTIAYAAYRQGYEPAQAEIQANKGDKKLSVRLVLKRAADYQPQDPPYLRTLYEVRTEISDWRANEHVTLKNQARLEVLRKRLEAAAGDAIKASDTKMAAAIYFWVAHLPEILGDNGELVGYTQTNLESERNVVAMEKAANLDKDNVAIQEDWLGLQDSILAKLRHMGQQITEDEWAKRRQELLGRMLELDRVAGTRATQYLHFKISLTAGYLGWRAEQAGQYEVALRYYRQKYDKLLVVQKNYPRSMDVSDDLSVAQEKILRVEQKLKVTPSR
jgi:hypothetical protein